MGYDKKFYEMYEAYLVEPTVRSNHYEIFGIAMKNPDFKNIVDFGCGLSNEFFVYAKPDKYTGVDVNVVPYKKGNKELINSNYRTCKNLGDLVSLFGPKKPTAFVSLFSVEITAPYQENYKFYEKVFQQIPTITYGLVSGFYYMNRINHKTVKETGGLKSYQTLEKTEDVRSKVFSEKRRFLHVPSEMFGSDVIEVWKFFKRK